MSGCFFPRTLFGEHGSKGSLVGVAEAVVLLSVPLLALVLAKPARAVFLGEDDSTFDKTSASVFNQARLSNVTCGRNLPQCVSSGQTVSDPLNPQCVTVCTVTNSGCRVCCASSYFYRPPSTEYAFGSCQTFPPSPPYVPIAGCTH